MKAENAVLALIPIGLLLLSFFEDGFPCTEELCLYFDSGFCSLGSEADRDALCPGRRCSLR